MGLLGCSGLLPPHRRGGARLFREDPLAAPLVAEELRCFLCERPLGRRVEWHHPVPKSRGGRETVPVHPICHRTIHAAIGNKELAKQYAKAEALRAHPQIATFIDWLKGKEPDFHAPTRRKKA